MKLKTAPARFKSIGDDTTSGAGEFEAIVSVFGNIDSWGDVVLPGAFTASIAEWKASPDTLPVLWSHRMDDPTYNIGAVVEIEEFAPGAAMPEWVDPFVKENGGLWVKGVIDTGDDASDIARHALRLLKARRVTQFSYAYDEVDGGPVAVGGRDAWGIKTARLYEVSPTQIGANELTELLAAKTFGRKVGRTLSAKNETNIRDARDLLTETLGSLDGSSDAKEAKREEPTVKREEFSTASIRLLTDVASLEAAVTN